ncbi:TfoX/Sxy family protein [Mangrovibrevibacter kandeliae]|uniref:TfoX/Sxy family protein n=1 Tax=Mangrovibrevibacter kandeliae TaxID=2968473 RepID=UPI0021180A7E|nr:TfoX/Sxy family protein [Aurantimonas sp. CSK15Z-1]MCQ8782552.1 TfoX/Sxy family protein [Aurantimonas sp. CSK15Z-1]
MDEEFVREVFASLGAITIRRMFGGQGIYASGRIVALVIRGDLYLKSDEEAAPLYEAAGSRAWTYTRPGRAPVTMPYYRCPEDGFDDPDAMAGWAAVADGAARRSEAAKAGLQKRRRRPKAALPDT